jgi:hypothetical protein
MIDDEKRMFIIGDAAKALREVKERLDQISWRFTSEPEAKALREVKDSLDRISWQFIQALELVSMTEHIAAIQRHIGWPPDDVIQPPR